jgi:hypothetical protein
MEILFFVLGCIILIAVLTDIIPTTLSMRGSGFITSRLSYGIWLIFLRISGNNGRSKILEHAGYSIVVATLINWVMLLWLSLGLMLLSDDKAIMNGNTKEYANVIQKFYYAGYVISTLGVGDFTVTSDFWRIVTNFYAFFGLVFITTCITYSVPIIDATKQESNLSVFLKSFGKYPEDIVLNFWNGKDFSRLIEMSPEVSQMLIEHQNNLKVYPIIHFFHDCDPSVAVTIRLASFYEALIIIDEYAKDEFKEDLTQIAPIRTAYKHFFKVIDDNPLHKKKPKQTPNIPQLTKLEKHGILQPHYLDITLNDKIQDHRSLITNMIQEDGWNWKEVYDPTLPS